ncbi:MAG: outer membrane lipoprotein carrier protein LolA [Candidatus Aminicenantaceae bacterium]
MKKKLLGMDEATFEDLAFGIRSSREVDAVGIAYANNPVVCYNSKTMRYIRNILGVVLGAVLLFSLTPEDVALRTEKMLHSLKSIQADFEHILYSMSITTPLKEKGKFYFRKPDTMKWVYQDPEEKIFLYEEGKFNFYIPEDNQLMRGFLSEENHESEILDILSGKTKLQDSYHIEFSTFPTENTSIYQLKLTPAEEDEFSHILVEIDEETWLIQKIIFFDWGGNKQEFIFRHIKINVRFPLDLFELKIPPDVEIIEK